MLEFKPTMHLRFREEAYTPSGIWPFTARRVRKILQQKWVSGHEEEWRDVALEK